MEFLNINQFRNADLRTAKIIEAEKITGSEKLIKLQVDLGERDESNLPVLRQIVAGIGNSYTPEELVGKNIVVVANLEPRKIMGFESRGMLLAASDESGLPVVIVSDKDVLPGSEIK